MESASSGEVSTEERIKEAARKVFLRKGYAATRTRDIAEASGINLALINYYFRSKEKLFEQIIAEKVQQLFGILGPVLRDEETDLDTKIERMVHAYIGLLLKNPDLPIFVLSEIRYNLGHLNTFISAKDQIINSRFAAQILEKQPGINPLQFILNILGMCVFPFVAQPVVEQGLPETVTFAMLMEERRKLLPGWIRAMLESPPLPSRA